MRSAFVILFLALLATCGPTKQPTAGSFLGSCRPTQTTAWCAEFHGPAGLGADGFCASFAGVFTLLRCGQDGRVATCSGAVESGREKAILDFHLYRMEREKARSICASQKLQMR